MKIRMFTLPNCLTLANLLCGCVAIVYATHDDFQMAFWCVAAAAVFDFADGFVARLTKQYSEIGAQLDSLADMVSFGVAPSFILLYLIMGLDRIFINMGRAYWFIVFAIAVFSALRLARFNVVKSDSSDFTGLPVPASALAIASLGYMEGMGITREALLVVVAVLCWLLVSNIRMFSLKFKGFGWRGNELKYCFLAVSAGLVAGFGVGGIAFVVALYVAVNVVRHFYNVRRAKI